MNQEKEAVMANPQKAVAGPTCNAGTYNKDGEELTAHILLEDDGYKVKTRLVNPSRGGIALASNRVYVFRDLSSAEEDNEVIRVRELVYNHSDTGNNLEGEITIATNEIQEEEIVTVIIRFFDKHGILLPRKPKVSIIRPDGPTTPSTVNS